MHKQTIELDLDVYSLDAIKKACYRLSDRFSSQIGTREGKAVCDFTFPAKASETQITSALDEFRKELLDQDLRDRIKTETEAVRNLILAHAFSKTGLIDDE